MQILTLRLGSCIMLGLEIDVHAHLLEHIAGTNRGTLVLDHGIPLCIPWIISQDLVDTNKTI